MYNNIPIDFKNREQWVLWKREEVDGKLTKVPYSKNGNRASVTNPYTWCDFETALSLVEHYDGLGFVLTPNDPFVFIDLDHTDDVELQRTQHGIFAQFSDTYSELSPSGKGLHILGKGSVPKGVKKSYVEIYSSHRFMTMTGNVYNNKPLADLQQRVMNIYSQIAPNHSVQNVLVGEPMIHSDEEILERVFKMREGEKFRDLYDGLWNKHFGSRSEADFSLINALSIQSRNPEQIKRIFQASGLADRDKAFRDDYVDEMVRKSFDNYLPPVEIIEQAKQIAEVRESAAKIKQEKIDKRIKKGLQPETLNDAIIDLTEEFQQMMDEHNNKAQYKLLQENQTLQNLTADYSHEFRDATFDTLPDGMVKEIARFIYAQSPRPIKTIAVTAALAFMSGICGRAYNVSGTGLNQYYILLAETGLGKESMAKGIDKLIASILPAQPKASSFVGLGDIASGQALIRYLSDNSNSFVSVQGEVSALFYKITAPNAPSHYIQLKKVLLDLYNKSGRGNILYGTQYSDTNKNTAPVKAPAVTILGESVPNAFYKTLTEGLIEDGLMARLTIFECEEQRVPLNENFNSVQVPDKIKQYLQILAANALTLNSTDRVVDVELDEEAKAIMREFDVKANVYMNSSHDNVLHQLWTRAAVKIMKTAALFAIGDNLYSPKINKTHISYATDIVLKTTNSILARYKMKEIGNDSVSTDKQMLDLELFIGRTLYDYPNYTESYLSAEVRANYIIPHRLIAEKIKNVRSYKEFRHVAKTVANLIRDNMYTLIEEGKISKIKDANQISKFNLKGEHYVVTDPQYFIKLHLENQ